MIRRLADFDAAERAYWLRALFWSVGPCTALAGLVAYYLHETRGLGGLGMLGVV